ncbi:alpha/beta hydrolase [Pseudomonas sp. Marseille-QA0892]
MPSIFDPSALRDLVAAGTPPDGRLLHVYRQYYGIAPADVFIEFFMFQAASYRIAGQAWLPEQPKGTWVLLHGYYDHMGLYGHLIRWALGQGFAVIACDLPGHGLSEGAPASIEDFGHYHDVLIALLGEADRLNLPAPWHLCGQSTGAAIVVDHLLRGDVRDEVGRSILLAPLVRPRAWVRSRLSYHALSPFVRELPRRFTVNSTDTAFIDFVHTRDPLQAKVLPSAWVGALARWIPQIESSAPSPRRPIVVQGDADLTVDWRYNLKVLKQKFDTPQTLLIPGARHHLANERRETRQQYLDFLKVQLEE